MNTEVNIETFINDASVQPVHAVIYLSNSVHSCYVWERLIYHLVDSYLGYDLLHFHRWNVNLF